MTLRHIQIFIAVCDTGSTVKASVYLKLAQPTISLGIKEIEQNYGIKLFDRISRSLVLTEAGRNFLIYAREINNNFLNLETQIKDYDKTNQLFIGSSITIGIFIIPKLIKEFQNQYPETKLNVVIKDSASIATLASENKIDIGFIESDNIGHESSMLSTTPFFKDRLVLVVSNKHKLSKKKLVSVKDLEGEQLILREADSAGRALIEKVFSKHKFEESTVWESISTDAILSMVSENLGISILPNSVVDNNLLKLQVKQINIDDEEFNRTYLIIHHKNKYLSHGAIDIMQMAKNFSI
ncbi:MAG: LysR family transcriptional regulator [Spirochaetaceae bacterium]|nr:LysR family transcriptional regulator [Spirochaetaceae bacterium]